MFKTARTEVYLRDLTKGVQDEAHTSAGKYFIDNFFKHYNSYHKRPRSETSHDILKQSIEEKTPIQIKFEKFLSNNRVLINDYARVVKDHRYFQIISNVIMVGNKLDCLYSSYDLSYKSDSCVFYAYDIPKNATEKEFKHIYNYLFFHGDSDRLCYKCSNHDSSGEPSGEHPFYFCISCGIYTCRQCVFKNLKFVLVGKTDIGYINCDNKLCKQTNILYRLPSHFSL